MDTKGPAGTMETRSTAEIMEATRTEGAAEAVDTVEHPMNSRRMASNALTSEVVWSTVVAGTSAADISGTATRALDDPEDANDESSCCLLKPTIEINALFNLGSCHNDPGTTS